MGKHQSHSLHHLSFRPWMVYACGALVMVTAIAYAMLLSPAARTVSTTTEQVRGGYEWSEGAPQSLSTQWEKKGYSNLVNTPGATIASTDHDVARINPDNGERMWEYSRPDATICDIAQAWNDVVVVYNAGKGCSDVTRLNAQSGQYVNQAMYATDQDQAKLVFGGDQRLALVTPTMVRVMRDDLVVTAEFGDKVDIDNPESIRHCTIYDTSIGPKTFTVASQCFGNKTTHVTSLELDPKDSTNPDTIVDVDTKSDKPVTTPITTLAQMQFVVQGNNPMIYTWQLDKDRTEVRSEPVMQGEYGWGSWDMPGIGYTWIIGDKLKVRYGSEDVSQTTHELSHVAGNPVEADGNILVPTYEGLTLWNSDDNKAQRISVDTPLNSRKISLSGGTVVTLDGDTLRAYS